MGNGLGGGAIGARLGLCAFAGVALRLPTPLADARDTPFAATLGVGLAATGAIWGWWPAVDDCWGSC